jgi:predicted esterase
VPIESAKSLAEMLRAKGMAVDHRIIEAGHQLMQEDVILAAEWLKSA